MMTTIFHWLITKMADVLPSIVLTKLIDLFYKSFVGLHISSEYSGEWADEIYSNKNKNVIVKKDNFEFQHDLNNNIIIGKGKRIVPFEQSHRRWLIFGTIRGDSLILIFLSPSPQKSNGCIYVKHKCDYTYEGYYLEDHNGNIDKTPIKIYKKL